MKTTGIEKNTVCVEMTDAEAEILLRAVAYLKAGPTCPHADIAAENEHAINMLILGLRATLNKLAGV